MLLLHTNYQKILQALWISIDGDSGKQKKKFTLKMERKGLACLCIFLVAVAISMVEGDQCDDEIQNLANNCSPILSGKSPSAVCCDLIRGADLMSCICPKVTPQIAALINVPQVVSAVESCGRNIPHNTRCGSIVTP